MKLETRTAFRVSFTLIQHYRSSSEARGVTRSPLPGSYNTSGSHKSAEEISRATRGRLVIGSQPHPARPVSAQRDTRRFIRRPLLLFPAHTYRKRLSARLSRWNRFISRGARSAISARLLLTSHGIIVRANVIKRIAPQVYCQGNGLDGGNAGRSADQQPDRSGSASGGRAIRAADFSRASLLARRPVSDLSRKPLLPGRGAGMGSWAEERDNASRAVLSFSLINRILEFVALSRAAS